MAQPNTSLTIGLNSYYLLELIENLAQLDIGYNPEIDDINQDLVLQFMKEGYNRIISSNARLPWFQSTWTFSTNADERQYYYPFNLISTFSPFISTYPNEVDPNEVAYSLAEVREVINIVNNTNSGNELIYIDHFKAESIWVGVNDTPDIPSYWSLWANEIYLWPRPNASGEGESGSYSMTIRGYRQPNFSWLTDSQQSTSEQYVDLDNEMQMLLINFVLARIFQFNEDAEMAKVYMEHFNIGMAMQVENLTSPNSNQPLIMSGGLLLNGAANTAYGWGNGTGIQILGNGTNPLGRAW